MVEQQQSAVPEEKGNYIEIKLSVPQMPRRNSVCGMIPGQFLSQNIRTCIVILWPKYHQQHTKNNTYLLDKCF